MPTLVPFAVVLLLVPAVVQAASDEEKREAQDRVSGALDAAADASARGDYAAAAELLRKASEEPSFAIVPSYSRNRVNNGIESYSRRARWVVDGEAKRLLSDLLLNNHVERPDRVDDRVVALIDKLRAEDASFARAFKPASVHVKAKDELAESSARRALEQLGAMGYATSTTQGDLVLELSVKSRLNGNLNDLMKSPSSISIKSCTAALSVKSSDPDRLSGAPEVRVTNVHVNEDTCYRRAAEKAGESLALELLRGWARANPGR